MEDSYKVGDKVWFEEDVYTIVNTTDYEREVLIDAPNFGWIHQETGNRVWAVHPDDLKIASIVQYNRGV